MNKTNGLLSWLRWGALVSVFVLAASGLSAWQFERRAERLAQIQLVLDNYDRVPVPLSEVSWQQPVGRLASAEWRPVEVSGTYLPGSERLVRNRPLTGRAGFLQLAALKLSDGRILIVERGWIATGSAGGMPEFSLEIAPSERTATVRLRSAEAADPAPSQNGSISAINLNFLAGELAARGEVITSFYGRLVSETPADSSYPVAMPKPNLGEGNHLSYALQWILFALLAVIALVWAIRRERTLASGVLIKRKLGRIAEEDALAEDATH